MTKKMLMKEQMISAASPGFGTRAKKEVSTAKTETTGGFMGGQSDYDP